MIVTIKPKEDKSALKVEAIVEVTEKVIYTNSAEAKAVILKDTIERTTEVLFPDTEDFNLRIIDARSISIYKDQVIIKY